jgi:putative FmdB family regulatory protein
MPTYEYECENCGPFSDVYPMSEFDRPQACPDCGEAAPRLLTVAAIGGGSQPADPSAPAPRAHFGGCACCAPRRLAADPV